MNNVNLKILGGASLNPTCLIDGDVVAMSKNSYGNLEGNFQTEKDGIQITIFRYLELNSRWWWLMSIVFFFISIFGLLNPPYDKKCIQIEYIATIKLKENNEINLKLNNVKREEKAISIDTICEVCEQENKIFVDKKAKKRLFLVRFFETIAWLGMIVIAIFLIIEKN